MSRKTIFSKIGVGLLALVIVVYVGFQVTISVRNSVETIEATVVTVENKISCEGVFIRDEQPITGNTSKTVEYLVQDGEKVANGEEIARLFDDNASLTAFHEMNAVQDEIDSLQYAYTHLSNGSDSAKLDSLITLSMLEITEILEQGNVTMVSGDYTDLLQLVIQRDGSKIDSAQYEAQLSALESERAGWQAQSGTGSVAVQAPAPGYFTRLYDGLGQDLTTDALDELTISDVETALSSSGSTGDVLGGIVTGFEWYFATAVTEEQAAVLKEKSAVTVRFPAITSESLRVSVYSVRTEADGQALLILRSGNIREEYLSARQAEVDIILDSYTGIRVPREALRQVDGEWGVYCLVGGMSRFKPVEWVYQTDSYYLVESAESSSKGLTLHDKIIVKGRDLEKDKVVK